MKIDQKILSAFEAASGIRGLMARICRETGIEKSQLSKYKSGTTKTMPEPVWKKLEPYLSAYIPDDPIQPGKSDGLTIELMAIWKELDFDERLETLKFASRLRQEKKSVSKSS